MKSSHHFKIRLTPAHYTSLREEFTSAEAIQEWIEETIDEAVRKRIWDHQQRQDEWRKTNL